MRRTYSLSKDVLKTIERFYNLRNREDPWMRERAIEDIAALERLGQKYRIRFEPRAQERSNGKFR